MQVWLSVAWMKSPGSMMLARDLVADARRDAVARGVVAHAGVALELALHVAQHLDLGRNRRIARHPVA